MVNEELIACPQLNAAYLDLRARQGKEKYVAFMKAFLLELKNDAFIYIPVRSAMPVAAFKDGKIQWSVVETPVGKMLSVFTNRAEVEKHPSRASIGVKLRAAFRACLSDKIFAGILVNPMDGRHGIPVERRNLEIMAAHIRSENGQVPQMDPRVVSNAVYRLWEIAVGVPTAVYDVSAEVEKLGGLDKILNPLLDKWQVKLQDSKEEFSEPMDYVKTVLRDVVSSGFVYGAMALKNPDLALEVDIEKCIAAIPDLWADIGQNIDEYLVLISDAVRSDLVEPDEMQVQLLIAGNLSIIAFGAFSFGLGWGMAKDAESQGVDVLVDLRDRQQAWIEKFKQDVIEKLQKQEEKGDAEDDHGK